MDSESDLKEIKEQLKMDDEYDNLISPNYIKLVMTQKRIGYKEFVEQRLAALNLIILRHSVLECSTVN